MDQTLSDYIALGDQIDCILENSAFLNINIINEKLQTLTLTISFLSQILNYLQKIKSQHVRKNLNRYVQPSLVASTQQPQQYQYQYQQPQPQQQQQPINQNNNAQTKSVVRNKEVAPGVNICAKIVQSIHQIPNSNMYWVDDINQFAIKINGNIYKGNIGCVNTQKNTKMKGVDVCRYDNCSNTMCPYYHAPISPPPGLQPVFGIPNVMIKKPNRIRNFSKSSWLYCDSAINSANISLRHASDRKNLKLDIARISQHPLALQLKTKHQDQLIHDLLVSIALVENV